MTPALERAARASHERNKLVTTGFIIASGKDPASIDIPELKEWNDLQDDERRVCANNVRAVLLALREPDEAMCEVPRWVWYVEQGFPGEVPDRFKAKAVWQAMIDAVLEDKP